MKNIILAAFVVVLASGCSQGGGSATPSGSISGDISGCYSLIAGQVTGTCGEENTSQVTSMCLEQEGNTVTMSDPNTSQQVVVDSPAEPVASRAVDAGPQTGTVNGNSFTISQSATFNDEECTITMEVSMDGTVTGDAIEGSMRGTLSSSGNCDAQLNCTTTIGYTGTRMPGVEPATAAAKTIDATSPSWFFLKP